MNVWFCLYRAILLGAVLGLFYGFLRPIRPRWLADLIFLAGLLGIWIYLCFGLCGADPRFGYTVTLLGGCLAWEVLFGKLLKPLFSAFWKGIFRILSLFLLPFKKNAKNQRICENFSLQPGKNGLQ